MIDPERYEHEMGERYRSMLQGYYERLQEQCGRTSAHIAIEEVKLRLFLSLLDQPEERRGGSDEQPSASLG
jgi:predicted AlkP superfamily phosphohydrolase/phosphomutase